VNREQAEQFVREHKQAVIATIGKDGRPQLSNVLVVYHEGLLLLSTTESTAKYRNLVRDPRASIHLGGDNFWQYLVVDAQASFTRMPEALPMLHTYYELAAGKPHDDWADYDRAMREDRRVLISFEIGRLYPLS